MSHGENITSQVSQLSAEVEPFVPSALPLPTSDPSGGTQPHVLPRYVTSCYPFVQPPEVTPEGYVQEVRWPSSVPNPQYNPYPPLSPQPHLPHYYPPHNTPPPPGPFLPHPSPYPPPLYAGYPPPPHLYPPPYGTRSPTQQVTKQKTRRRSGSRSVQTKSIAVQKEASSNSPVHNRHRTIILLDASQQTDFPDDIADKSLRDKPSPLLRKSKARRLASRRPQDPSSTDSEEDEGGIDSDSGYSSPKHGRNQSANSSTSEAATGTCIVQQAGAPLDYAGYIPPHYYQAYGFTHHHTSHVGLTHPPPPGPMIRQDTASPRGRGRGRGAWGQPPPPLPGEAKGKWRQRKRSPKNSGGREREEHPELDGSTLPSTPRSVASSDAESLQFHDEMEFPSLGAPQQSQAQNPSAPMSYSAILQTAAPPKQLPGSQEPLNPATVVSTPVEVKKEGKNARKKRKKALLAAKAAAEEYSEITQEQSKLQEIQKKASGKKSKQPMQLDLGDMLAALEKRQQELKLKTAAGPAKTAAVSTGTVPVQVVSSDNKQWSGKKEASNVSMPHNPLDSHAPAVKRGKERETPHKKKPSALKKVILKEREDKKMQKLMEDQAHSDAETGEVPSSTACYIPFSMEDSDGGTSQEGENTTNSPLSAKFDQITQDNNAGSPPDTLKPVELVKTSGQTAMEDFNDDDDDDDVDDWEEEPKAMSAPEPKEEEYYGALSQDDHSFRGSMSLSATGSELSPLSQAMSPINFSPLSSASPLSSGTGSPLCAPSPIGPKIHSRRFREYCNQVLDKEIDATVTMLLQDLVRFQDRQYHKDPIKAKAKRRIVMGLREVTKHLKLRKLKCIIIAPNLEKIQSKGGLDDAIETILNLCMEQDVPFVFALGRKALGRAVNKLVPVSVVGVFNYDGAEEHFKTMVELTTQARNAYIDMVTIYRQEWEQMQAMRNSGQPIYPAHLGHSRNPSAASAVSFSSVLSETISECHPEHDGDIEGPKIKVEAAKVTEESKVKGQEERTEQGAVKAEPTKESLNSETENNLKENSSESNSDRADVESESSEGPESVSRHSEIVEFPPAYDDVLTSSAATTVVNGAESEVTDVVEEEGDVLNTSCSSSKLRVLDTGRIESWVVEASQCVEKLDLDPQQHAEEKIDPDQKKAESKVTAEQDSSKDLRADSKPDVDTRPGRNVSPSKQMDSSQAEEQNTANCDLSNLKQNVQLQSEGGEVSAEKKTIARKDEDSTAGQTGSLSEPADEDGKFNGTVSMEINDR